MRSSRRAVADTVCLAAILKDEDPFVEEWVAYHRLLGVDHFHLYDNDPRQPLSEILALHRDYVTVRTWLIDHAGVIALLPPSFAAKDSTEGLGGSSCELWIGNSKT
jgi:hypothetical protein